MSTMSNSMAPRAEFSAGAFFRGAGSTVKRWWAAYINWRLEQMAINRLRSMSDRELKDIGVYRASIDFAVRGRSERHAVLNRFC